jgi:SOS response regulatory protein OraA/RecX
VSSERQYAIDAAARLLRHGDRSRLELEQRLARRGIEPDAVAAALETLERVGVLDEVRTAELRAARLAERGYGDAYIRAELERRGLPVDGVLAQLEPEAERAARLVAKRRVDASTAAWLTRRGFGEDAVDAVFAS